LKDLVESHFIDFTKNGNFCYWFLLFSALWNVSLEETVVEGAVLMAGNSHTANCLSHNCLHPSSALSQRIKHSV